jgi:glutamate synthase (NADPH/NADH) small chain
MLTEEIIAEAKRCLDCKNAPCVAACPAHNNIPLFMKALKNGNFAEANAIWEPTSNLPGICGRLCQNETLCVGHCTMNKVKHPLAIGVLEAEVADRFLEGNPILQPQNGKKHLVVGLGPSGIANAMEMAKLGYSVDAIDANHSLGGALENLIPEFRFDKDLLKRIAATFTSYQINARYDTRVGVDVFLNDLIPQYDTLYVATGSDLPMMSDIDSDGLPIHYAHNLLNRNLYTSEVLTTKLGKNIIIIGLGNVAVDMARMLVRLERR